MAASALSCPSARASALTTCSSVPRPPRPAKFRGSLAGALGLGPKSAPQPKATAQTTDSEEEEAWRDIEIERPNDSKVTSLDNLSTLAGRLLMNAASLRVVRGQTYCTHCRGTGKETCTACQGSGIVEPEKVRMNQMRHAAGKLKVLLGVDDAKMHDGDWQKTNRCRRCHGTGALTCKHCGGSGRLGPAQ